MTNPQASPLAWNAGAYLTAVRQHDAQFLTAATNRIEAAEVLNRITPGSNCPADDNTMARAFGNLSYRCELIIQRLERAETRLAELEAELADLRTSGPR